MNTARYAQCETIWAAAAASTYGICVRTNNPTKARAALYDFRQEVKDPALGQLSIRIAPDNTEGAIWIINNRNEALVADLSLL